MARDCHPVWKEFAWRRFGKGDSVEEFLRRFPPSQREDSGRQGTYHYHKDGGKGMRFTGVTVSSWDGHLIRAQAWSCTWQFTFFETGDAELVAKEKEKAVAQAHQDSQAGPMRLRPAVGMERTGGR